MTIHRKIKESRVVYENIAINYSQSALYICLRMEMNDVLRRLKTLRAERSLSQADISAMLDIDQTTYSNWETGKAGLYVESLLKISKRLNVSISYFFQDDAPLIKEPSFQFSLMSPALRRLFEVRFITGEFSGEFLTIVYNPGKLINGQVLPLKEFNFVEKSKSKINYIDIIPAALLRNEDLKKEWSDLIKKKNLLDEKIFRWKNFQQVPFEDIQLIDRPDYAYGFNVN